MAEEDENIPMPSHSWLWKKRRNSIFPTVESKSESKTGAWIQTDFPSSSHTSEDGLRNNVESKSQSNIISWISLPGSVTDVIEEVQAYPIKNIVVEEETGHGYPSSPGQLFPDVQLDGYQSKEELFYIPYRSAKLYIMKLAKDLHQMKLRYVKVIKELEHVGKENQKQAIMAVENQYSDKIKHLRSSLETYQEMVGKEKKSWQDTRKRLEEENRKLRHEKEELMNLIQVQGMNADTEESWLLKSIMQKLHCLYTQHNLTIKELHRSRLGIENVQKMVTENRETEMNAREIKSDTISQNGQGFFVVDIEEAQDYLPEKKFMLEVKTNLEQIRSSLQKRETEIKDLLQTEHWCNPQITEAEMIQ
ncbi:chromosome partition protein Smc-like isoform X4 [Erythrolamprus reginae]|uniref:chromosome partition protein Smc-like isoform X4 n=1 Tax=Erythrolamprus reginae TaxID=121349 RepID=UPI00396C750C